MSELTFQTQSLHECLDCQFKHAVDLKAHMNKTDPNYKNIEMLIDSMAKEIGMKPGELRTFEQVRAVEHKLEDYQTVLRNMRRQLASGEPANPREYKPYAWTAYEKAHPEIQRKIISCVKQIEKKQVCPPAEWGTSPTCVNPYSVCRASIVRRKK